jgi:hypothetical protein
MVISPGTYALLGLPQRRRSPGKPGVQALPLLHQQILAHLAVKATNAHGYAAIQLAGHTAEEMDVAIGALHHDGLLNAFFIDGAARPRFHASSLTGEGRRIHDRKGRLSAS